MRHRVPNPPAIADTTAIAIDIRYKRGALVCDRMSLVADSPSGTFDTNTATRKPTLTDPPNARLMPRTIDSGMPSSSAPSAIAVPGDPPEPRRSMRPSSA
jgi:hypothetical protein